MTDTLKILGQSAPAANTATSLYTVPSSTSTMVSHVSVCNTNAPGTGAKIRVWFQVAGAGDTTKQYLYYDFILDGGETLITSGVTLATTDVIRVQTDTANVAFQAFGDEVT